MNLGKLIVTVLVFCVLLIGVISNENKNRGALPYCGEDTKSDSKRLVLVSTLDGKLSALNIEEGGLEKWSVRTQPGAMLSSSIHTLELTNNGQWVRMIPSLSGGLYKFNGDDIEPIPITAENLLKSSFRYSDDLVISGGKESRTYGVDMRTGRVLYECSMSRCDNLTGAQQEFVGDVVLVQRLTQTVRAIEPRSGIERWNFSVGQHDIKMAPNPEADCHSTHDPSSDFVLKVIVPDGLVCAISKTKPGTILWKHKFEFPIVSAWQVVGSQLKWVDLFGGAREGITSEIPDSPLLYVGMHNKQLYIQESVTLQRKVLEGMNRHPYNLVNDESSIIPRIPWKPVSASERGKTLGIAGPSEPILQITDETSQASTTGLSVLYGSEYVNGNGFFLYSSESLKKKETALCAPGDQFNNSMLDKSEEVILEEDEEETPVKIIIVSMWYWWKEITLLTITTAVAINVLLQRRIIAVIRSKPPVIIKTVTYETTKPGLSPAESYVSRYLADFDPVHCLGKGGFGIVFEAKNKIDDCHYAIKRIPLPNKEHSRKRVMREVKALAKLDNQNIVRYFNAWVEMPPAEWQAKQDQIWAQLYRDELRSGEATTVDLSGAVTPTSEPSISPKFTKGNEMKNRKRQDILKSLFDRVSSVYSPQGSDLDESNQLLPRLSNHLSISDDKSDSYIVFKNSTIGLSPEADKSESIIFKTSSGSDGKETDEEDFVASVNDQKKISKEDLLVKENKLCRTNGLKRPTSLRVGQDTSCSSMGSSTRVYLYIQMQLCQRDSLREWLTYCTHDSRDQSQVINIFSQIVQAVEYVHLQGLIHRDLKPSNIFFSPDGQIKVGDFGLVTGMVDSGEEFMSPEISPTSPCHDDRHTARVGTHLYMSPEQLAGRQYSYKVDIYSLGLILFELLVPFGTQMERYRTLTDVRNNKFPSHFKQQYPNEYELLKQMLCEEPDKRLTTIGIRHREPLRRLQSSGGSGNGSCGGEGATTDEWHFELPRRRRNSSTSRSFSNDS